MYFTVELCSSTGRSFDTLVTFITTTVPYEVFSCWPN